MGARSGSCSQMTEVFESVAYQGRVAQVGHLACNARFSLEMGSWSCFPSAFISATPTVILLRTTAVPLSYGGSPPTSTIGNIGSVAPTERSPPGLAESPVLSTRTDPFA